MTRSPSRRTAVRGRSGRSIAALAAFTVLAAACGGDDGSSSPDPAPATTGALTAETDSDESTAEETGPDDSTEGSAPTAADDATSEDSGSADDDADGTAASGGDAGAFALDLSACPSGWDPTEGITDTEIRFGTSRPESGPLAVLQFLTRGIQAYFTYVNGEFGGVDGRELVLIERDDAYEPARTVTNVIELVERERVFGLIGVVGTPNNLAVRDDLNRQCIPHLFNTTGAQEWGEVDEYPWTTGATLPYPAEAAIWVAHLNEQFPDGVTVALLGFDNDFGLSYERAFERAVEGTSIEIISREHHEATAPNLRDQVTTMAASGADVLLGMTTGAFCPMLIETVEQSAWDPLMIISATCAAPQATFAPITPAGDGVLVAASQRTVVPGSADPAVQAFTELLEQWAPDTPASIGVVVVGWQIGEMLHESLLAALEMDGGLTRDNVLLGARSLDMDSSMLLEGIRFRMDGAVDPFPLEAARMQAWRVAENAYEPVSEVFDYEGRTTDLLR